MDSPRRYATITKDEQWLYWNFCVKNDNTLSFFNHNTLSLRWTNTCHMNW